MKKFNSKSNKTDKQNRFSKPVHIKQVVDELRMKGQLPQKRQKTIRNLVGTSYVVD